MRVTALLVLAAVVSVPVSAQQQRTAVTDLGRSSYLGFEGGLYRDSSNEPPPDHRAAGLAFARSIRPLDRNGLPSAAGKIVLLSIGMSNTTQEFCSSNAAPPCASWSFTGLALGDPAVDRSALVIANGAMGGQAADTWDSPTETNYARIQAEVLARQNLTEAQVQAAWVKVANPQPQRSLPSADADAFRLVSQIGNIVRAMKSHYPNLRLVFLSSRIYAGYATTALNPEPFAYESAFALKWLIDAQVQQMRSGAVDPLAGNLDSNTAAPWVGWGPYLWADGLNPRSDGLIWTRADFQVDGTHPSSSGQEKVGRLLLEFFKSSEFTRAWFLGQPAERRHAVRH